MTMQERYPAVEITDDFDEVLRDPRVDAIAIATPVSSHFRLALKALMAGKHVFVEKPMAATAERGAAADRRSRASSARSRGGSYVRAHRRRAQDA